jgi:regulatory protein
MPIITSLEQQQGDPERINVYLDGTFAFGAAKLVALSHQLTAGQELSEHEVEELRREDAVERAYAAALNFLSFRPRSRREIEQYFRKKKVDAAIVPPVVERLERLGLVDDHQFARYWVENRQTFRPRGSRALRMELRQKGLEGDIIDDALEGVEEDEERTAYAAGLKKLRAYARLDEREFFSKMATYLQRRGFPYEVAATVVRQLEEVRSSAGEEGGENENLR